LGRAWQPVSASLCSGKFPDGGILVVGLGLVEHRILNIMHTQSPGILRLVLILILKVSDIDAVLIVCRNSAEPYGPRRARFKP